MKKIEKDILKEGKEIAGSNFRFLDKPIEEVVSGNVSDFMEINKITSELFISHKYLTDMVRKETGNHPCYLYDLEILDLTKRMLSETDRPVSEILSYDPSDFSKFFKKFYWTNADAIQKR